MLIPLLPITVLLGLVAPTRAKSCVWLDTSDNNSTVAATGYSPCTSASVSTCCADTDACLSNGYCSGGFGLYRGACTDWSAGVCPDTCADLSFVSEGSTYYLANLYRCNGGGRGETWWCGDQSADTTAQPCQSGFGSMFSMTSIGTFMTPVPLVAAATVSSAQTNRISGLLSSSPRTNTATGSSASATSGTSSPSATIMTSASGGGTAISPSNTSALGIGLGLGLGVPLIAAIIALTYLLARRKGNASPASEKQQILHQPHGWSNGPKPEEIYGKQIQEVLGSQRSPVEIGGRDK